MAATASDPTVDLAVDPVRIEALYADLDTMQVELDADPLELGPKRLNEKIAQCRGMLSRCETMFLSVSRDLYKYKRRLRAASADYKLRKQELFANDPEVRMGRNVADREAVAGTKLRAQAEEIDQLTACVEDLGAVLTVVRTKRADLKDTQGRLRDQLKVCQEELTLGSRWGKAGSSKRPPSNEGDSVQSLFDEVLGPAKVPAVEEELPEDPDPGPSPPPQDFMGDPEVQADQVLDGLPDDPEVPEVDHPDNEVFTDDGIEELLSSL
jgi:hypothetical protein